MRRRYMSMNYVYPRSNGLLEMRYPIPESLRGYFPKKSGQGFRSWIGGSLGTRDVGSANIAARERIERYEKLFEVLRGDTDAEAVERFLRYAYEQELKLDEAERLDALGAEGREKHRQQRLRAYFNALRTEDNDQLEAVAGWLADVIQDHLSPELSVPSETAVRRRFLKLASKLMIDATAAKISHATGAPAPKPSSFQTNKLEAPDPGENLALSPAGKKSVADYWPIYENRLRVGSMKARSLDRRRHAWDKLVASVGPTTALWKVTKSDLWKLADELSRYPMKAGSIKKLKHLSYHQRLAYADANPDAVELLQQATLDDYLRHISGLFQHAVDRGDLDRNPVPGVTATSRAQPNEKRDKFEIDELNRLFKHRDFSTDAPPHQRNDCFWVPLLELFTGGRASELYLRTSDLFPDEEVPHIRLVEWENRSLKNAHSKRLVPIHPALIELGFLDKCRAAIKSGQEYLFPEWQFPPKKNPSEGYRRSKRFRRTLVEAGVTRTNVTAHSFRHNFETAMADAGLPQVQALRLTGRAIPGSPGVYIKELSLDAMRGAVGRIKYPGLILPR